MGKSEGGRGRLTPGPGGTGMPLTGRGFGLRGRLRRAAQLIPTRGSTRATGGELRNRRLLAEGAAGRIGAAARVDGDRPGGAPQRGLRDETAGCSRGEAGLLVYRAEPEDGPSRPSPVPAVALEEVEDGEGGYEYEHESEPGGSR